MLAPMICPVQSVSGTHAIPIEGDTSKNAPPGKPRIASHNNHNDEHLACEVQNGIPIVRGGISGYYVFNQNRQRLLILSRKRNQSIVIDNYIDIVVLEISENEVKLGVIGPDDIAVRAIDYRENNATPLNPR